VALYDLMVLAGDPKASDQVRAIASVRLEEMKKSLADGVGGAQDPEQRAHLFFGAAQIEQFQKDPSKLNLTPPSEPPDGPPIGADDDFEIR